MESIIDNEREEAKAIEREPADRPTWADVEDDRMVPDVGGRDIIPFDPEVDPF